MRTHMGNASEIEGRGTNANQHMHDHSFGYRDRCNHAYMHGRSFSQVDCFTIEFVRFSQEGKYDDKTCGHCI